MKAHISDARVQCHDMLSIVSRERHYTSALALGGMTSHDFRGWMGKMQVPALRFHPSAQVRAPGTPALRFGRDDNLFI
jgi:hypothetical protein